MEELDEYYEETLAEKLNIESKLPTKWKDPGTFTIPLCLGKVQGRTLCDLGSSINLMPLKFAKKWEIGELNTNYATEIVLADPSIIRPSGMVKDVIVKVNKLLFPVDFTIVDIEVDTDVPIILGRPFLATSRAVIDMEKEELKLRMGDEEQLIYIQGKNDWCCMIESIERKNPGWRMKVTMEELEEGLEELDLEKKSYPPAINIADVKKEDLCVRRWGRFRKVVVRSEP
ncbi:hypothetical protein A2U01_0018861 [Trifolium medium]|uniref:Aspartic peptidase DDI1-type domain-containing protein n=1 Tax=Trifolium medium TaxID=97028 RepID=A0A392NH73_9FABA|nr:hypothetical protein [Trifolium medium]